MRVLVTAAGGALAPLNIKLLKRSQRHKVWVLATDTRPEATGRHVADAFARVPPGDDPAYLDALVAEIEAHGIELVIPWSDEEALAMAEGRAHIEATGARLACAATETLRIMNDKAASFRLLADACVKVPDWAAVEDRKQLLAAADRLLDQNGAFVFKPSVARGNRGTVVVDKTFEGATRYGESREWHMDPKTFSTDHLPAAAAALPGLVMERLYPPAYDIDVLAWRGALLRAAPRRRLNPAGVPFTGGVLSFAAPLLDLARGVTEALRLDWLYDYDIMTTWAGEPIVIEINPRPSGSIAAAILAGMPFYDDLLSLAKGEPLPEIAQPAEVAALPYLDCLIVPAEALP